MTITITNANDITTRQFMKPEVDPYNFIRTIFNSLDRQVYTAIRETVGQSHESRKAKIDQIFAEFDQMSKNHRKVAAIYQMMIAIKEPHALTDYDEFLEEGFSKVTLGEVYFILWNEKMYNEPEIIDTKEK